MHKKQSVWLHLAVASFLIPFLVVGVSSFPFLGVGVSLIIVDLLVYFHTKPHSRFNKVLFLFILLLSCCVFIWSNPFIVFLDSVAALGLGAYLSRPGSEGVASFVKIITSPLTTVLGAIVRKNEFTLPRSLLSKQRSDKTTYYLRSVIVSIIVLLILVPILASVNPFFSKFVGEYLGLEAFFEFLFSANIYAWTFRLFFAGLLLFFLPRLLSYSSAPPPEEKELYSDWSLFIPKVVVAVTLLVFFVTQAQLYFSSEQTLRALGYNNSEYAREVFAQLTIVSIIILTLLYNDKSRSKHSRYLTYMLLVFCGFLATMALKSDLDYIGKWGYTYNRLWGLAGVFWITGALILFAHTFYKKYYDSYLIKRGIAFSAFTLLAINVLNFDYLIYHFRKSTTESGVDYAYLSRLSADAQAYQDLVNQSESKEFVRYEVEYLQKKYKSIDVRTFNLNEYLQYRSVASVDVQPFSHPSEPLPTPEPMPFNNPSQVKTEVQPDGSTLVTSDYGYSVTVPPEWKVVGPYSNVYEFQLVRCGLNVKVEDCAGRGLVEQGTISFNFLDQNYDLNRKTIAVEDWLKTSAPGYWYDWSTGRSVPYVTETVQLKNGVGVLQSFALRDTENRQIYLPYKNQILRGQYLVSSNIRVDAVQMRRELEKILQSYTIVK